MIVNAVDSGAIVILDLLLYKTANSKDAVAISRRYGDIKRKASVRKGRYIDLRASRETSCL